MLLERFIKFAREECRLDPNRPLLVGVSGGADSLALLDLLVRAGYNPTVAHFDHQLRLNSGRDAEKVAEIAASYGCELVSACADVRLLRRDQHLTIEQAARHARYEFLFKAARDIQAEAVVVGHTADDQVETVLMHILRGSGLDGLRGMSPRTFLDRFSAVIPLTRPLLSVWRSEIDAYCRERELMPLQDESNLDQAFTRNRIRHSLLPVLETYNPNIRQRLWTMAAVVNASLALLAPQVEQAYREAVIESYPEFIVFNKAAFSAMQPGLGEMVLRKAVREITLESDDLSWDNLLAAAAELRGGRTCGEFDLADGLYLQFSQGRVYLAKRGAELIERNWPAVSAGQILQLDVPGSVSLKHGARIEADWEEFSQDKPRPWEDSRDESTAYLDAERVNLPLTVRGWRAGDTFQPLGMQGKTVKVADFFNRSRIPVPAKKVWALVFSGNDLAWVTGMRLAHFCRVGDTTQKIIRLRLVRE